MRERMSSRCAGRLAVVQLSEQRDGLDRDQVGHQALPRRHASRCADLDLEIADGEFMILVGPSGCGKTTLLRMIAGLEAITDGEILDRRARRQRPHAAQARHRDGVPELRAVPAHDRGQEHGLCAASAPACRPRRSDRKVRGGRRAAGDLRPAGPQAGEPLRRPAPAGRDGPRDRPRPDGVPDGRAALQPRREAARSRRARRSCGSSAGWAPPPCTSPTTRPRR